MLKYISTHPIKKYTHKRKISTKKTQTHTASKETTPLTLLPPTRIITFADSEETAPRISDGSLYSIYYIVYFILFE